MKISKIIALLALLVATSVMVYAKSQMLETEQIYQEGNEAYEDLRDQIKISRADGPDSDYSDNYNYNDDLRFSPQTVQTVPAMINIDEINEAENPPETKQIYIPDSEIDFKALNAINSDAVAWLYSPRTVIDYPVMKTNDYYYSLHHLPNGKKNGNGSLFLDYSSEPDFSSILTVIYGHHMKSGSMFGSLQGYKKQAYYEQHPYMYLYTEQGDYRIDLLYGCIIGAGQWSERVFMHSDYVEELLEYAAYNTTFKSNTSYTAGDRVVALSTCSYEFDDARYVVIGILREANE